VEENSRADRWENCPIASKIQLTSAASPPRPQTNLERGGGAVRGGGGRGSVEVKLDWFYQREQRWVAPADCRTWGKWGLKEFQMKGVLPRLGSWACRVGIRDFFSDLAALVGPVHICFAHPALFQFICPHCPASWTGSRCGSPVS
jgi:hypothetical protein